MDPSVAELVRLSYPAMSEKERQIADYLLGHERELTFASASQVARLVGVSASTVVRFAQHLGFTGYVDLQARLHGDFNRGNQLETVPVDRARLIERLIAQETENLEGIAGNSAALLRAATRLAEARRLWILGSRASQHLAGLATHLFSLIRSDVWQLSPAGSLLPDALQDMDEEDVILVFSMTRYARETVRFAEHAARTVPLVLVTDEHASPLVASAETVITFSSTPTALVRSFTAAVATLQALFALTASDIGQAAVSARLEDSAHLWQDFETFVG